MAFCRLALSTAVFGVVSLFGLTGHEGGSVALAQSSSPQSAPPGKASPPGTATKPSNNEGVIAPVIQWLERANREYQDTVVQQLSVPTGRGGDGAPAQTKEPQAKLGVIQQVQEWLGFGGAPSTTTAQQGATSPNTAVPQAGSKDGGSAGQGTPEQLALEKRAADEAMRRQREARALEIQRAADEQKLTAEAKKAKDAVDQATRERQAIAENARLAEEQRRAAGAVTAAKEPAAKEPATTTEKDARATADAKQGEASARDRAKAVADKASADKAAEVARTEASKTEAANKAQKAAEAKAPVVPAPPPENVRVPDGKAEPKDMRDNAQKSEPNRRDARSVSAQDSAKSQTKPDRDAERLADAANRAGNSAMDKLAHPRTGHKTTVIGAAMSSREAKQRSRGGRKCAGAGEDVDPPATYVVKRGDTLWSISRRHYDKGHRFEKIVRANDSKIDDPDMIFPCQKLMLPS